MSKKEFTINDIQTGDIIVTRNRGNAIVITGRLKTVENMFSTGGLADLKYYDNNLMQKEKICKDYDIEKIYRIINPYDYGLDKIINELPKDKVELIWKREKEIDWTKVPRFTKVQVRDSKEEEWKNRYFSSMGFDKDKSYKVTIYDEFTCRTGYSESSWRYIRIYDESDIKEEWYK